MTDETLVTMLKEEASKNEAFRLLIRDYKEQLYRFVRKIMVDHQDTDEVVQLTFIKVYKYIEGYKAHSRLYTWMCAIARKEAYGFLTEKAKRSGIPIEELGYRAMQQLKAESAFYPGNEIQLKLQTAVSRLPVKQREVFNMKYFDKLLFREISEITGVSEGGLKANYHLAVKRLKVFLTET